MVHFIYLGSGCGDDYSSSYDESDVFNTGSYVCSIKWPEDVPTLESKSTNPRAIDCDAAAIITVAFAFYDGSGNYLTGDEWSCSLHQGTVNGIPTGTDRRLVVTGKDASGAMLYWGEETEITIVAGQTTQGGEIEMEYVYGIVPSTPTNVTATAGNEEITISWDSVTGAISYNIYWSTSQGVTKDTGTKISTFSNPHTHRGLTNGTTYYYVVTAENSYGESADSSEVSETPSVSAYPNTAVDTIPVGISPRGIAVTPDGSYVYVANQSDGTVSVIRTSDNTVVDTISGFGSPWWGVAVTPNGGYVYVGDLDGGTVSVIRTSDNTVTDTISVGNKPHGIAVTPNGGYVYVADENDRTVSVIQTSDNTVVDTVSVGDHPRGVAVTPNGGYAYVTNGGDNTVSVIQTSDNSVVDTISVGGILWGIAVAPNGSYVYVTNSTEFTVSVIQTSDNTVVDIIFVGSLPRRVAVTPDGGYVYVANLWDDTVSVIQTSDNSVVDTISVGDGPEGIAVTPDGSCVYVTNTDDDTVSVIGF